MIISWNWLSQYIRLDMPSDELAERLMMAGFNHEGTADIDGDLAIDLEVTSNRADCLSHLGIAREVGVLFERAVNEPAANLEEAGEPSKALTRIAVDESALCPLFTASVVSGVKIGESPWWMRQRLKSLGVRAISNIVDITNYVMFECGQPLHTYDLDLLAEHRLVVRRGRAGETIKAINGRTYELSPEMLTIADANVPVGVAGVMGGLDTEIGPKTQRVLIEAAVFDPVSVRSTARALGLHSPSSFRFERGIDPGRTEWANRRCAELILELAGGTLHPGVIVVGGPPSERPPITLRFDQIERVLGIAIPPKRAAAILRDLGLSPVEEHADRATFLPPSWRKDLEREIDLIEEVARIHGYDQIPTDRDVPLVSSARSARERVEAEVRAALTGIGLNEAYTPSLVAEEFDIPMVANPPATALRVDHSTRRRENVLRRGLVPSLLGARALNFARAATEGNLFEIACVYLPTQTGLPNEPTHLAIVSGSDFPKIKGTVEVLLERLRLSGVVTVHPVDVAILAAGRAAEFRIDGVSLGVIGEVSAEFKERFGLKSDCAVAELAFDALVARAQLIPQFQPLPEFPAAERDISLLVDPAIRWSEIEDCVRSAAGPLLEAMRYLDTFRGPGLPENTQSVHFGLTFRHPQRTLAGEEVEALVAKVVEACQSRLGATLRT